MGERILKSLLLAPAALALLAGSAMAGNLIMEAPAEPEVIVAEPAGSMSGSGAWLIPLLAIGLVALAVSQSDDDSEDDDDDDDPK
jgi:hypothetical protein